MKANDKYIFNKLKTEFEKINVPDLKHEIKLSYLMNKNQTKERNVSTINRLRYLTPSLIGALAVFILVFSIFTFTQTINSTKLIEGDKNMVSFQAFTAISLMEESSTLQTSFQDNNYTFLPLAIDTTLRSSEDEVDIIHKYLPFIDQVLSLNQGFTITSLELPDKVGFKYQDNIQVKTSLGQTIYYSLYYNLNTIKDFEIKKEFALEGIIVYNNTEYLLSASKEIKRNRSTTSLLVKTDSSNWVFVNQVHEQNAENYQYEMSNNGNVSTSRIKIEKNRSKEIIIDLEHQDRQTIGNYRFTKETIDNQNKIKIQVLRGNLIPTTNYIVNIIRDQNTDQEMYEYRNVEKDEIIQRNKDRGQSGRNEENETPRNPDTPTIPNHPGNQGINNNTPGHQGAGE